MDYASSPPKAAELVPYVLTYAQVRGDDGPREKVIPSRTGGSLVISLTGGFRVGGVTVGPGEAVVFPPRDGPLRMEFLPGPSDRMMVRLGPCGLARFGFDLPQRDGPVRSTDVGGVDGLAALQSQLRGESLFERRAALLESFFLDRYRAPSPEDRALETLADAIAASRGEAPSLGALLARVPLSRRQCERRFRELTGLSPRTFARICRFERAKDEVLSTVGQARSLTRIGLDSGYYDQAHFSRDFKKYSDLRPTEFAFCPVPRT